MLVNEAMRGERGGQNNPFGRAGKPDPGINRDIVTVDSPVLIPITPRDHAREAPTGNSVSYALRRLQQRPELLDKVKAGELTPNRAMVEAGFRRRSITIPDDPPVARINREITLEPDVDIRLFCYRGSLLCQRRPTAASAAEAMGCIADPSDSPTAGASQPAEARSPGRRSSALTYRGRKKPGASRP